MHRLFRRRLLLTVTVFFALVLAPFVYSTGTLSITISTNKTQYSPGNTVQVSGKVVDSQGAPVAEAAVSIQVGDPPIYGGLVYSSTSGGYAYSFIMPNQPSGQYTIYATASRVGYTSAQQQTQITLTQNSSPTSTSSTSQPSKCFIATATYGSEISPEVALLRNFRDANVLQTSSGTSFMFAFNEFYYGFSPQVASIISSHEALRATMRVALYPLIGTLYMSSRIFHTLSSNAEVAITLSGIFAAFGIGAVYFAPIAAILNRLARSRGRPFGLIGKTMLLGCCSVSVLALALAELTSTSFILTPVSVSTVLSFLLLGAFSSQSLATKVYHSLLRRRIRGL